MRKEDKMQKRIFLPCRRIFPAFIILVLVLTVHTGAQAAPYFEGKAITIVVPFSPGGGSDTLARLLARHVRKYIPGNPNIVVRDMPGADGLIGAHHVYFHKRSDGRKVLVSSANNVNKNILRLKGVKYYLEKMHPVYALPVGAIVVCKPGLIKEPKDIVKAKGLIFGHTSPTGTTGSAYVWSKELLGFKSKEIWGYGGSGDARMAFISGEVNISGSSTGGFNASYRPYVDRGEATLVFQTGVLDEKGNVVREEAAGDLTMVSELYEQIYGKKPSGPVWEAFKLGLGSCTFGKSALLPANTPPEIVNIYRDAFAKMVKDREFLKESTRLQGVTPHIVGKELAENYPAGVAGPPEVVQFMRKTLSEKYNIRFD
jgi:tripartite-type tricarboxylate transporter receptor subunit TctC